MFDMFLIQYGGAGSCCYTTLIILILLRNVLAVKLLLLVCSVADDWADLHLAARFLVLMGAGRRRKRHFYSHLLFISWLIDPVPPLNSSAKPSPGQGISGLGIASPKEKSLEVLQDKLKLVLLFTLVSGSDLR